MKMELEKLEEELFIKYEKKKKEIYENRRKTTSQLKEFWLNVLLNTEMKELIMESDLEVLKHLKDIKVNEEENGYIIEFIFDENEFFKNKVLKKTYSLKNMEYEIKGTKIEWKEGKDVTKRVVSKNEKKGTKKVDNVDVESFFQYFRDSSPEDESFVPYINHLDFGDLIRKEIYPKAIFFLIPNNFMDIDDNVDDQDDEDDQEDDQE
jgi:nucleosome assembly protein 1-like 1